MSAKYRHDFYNTTSSLSASFWVPNLAVRKRYSFSDSTVRELGLLVVTRKMDARIALAGQSVASSWDSSEDIELTCLLSFSDNETAGWLLVAVYTYNTWWAVGWQEKSEQYGQPLHWGNSLHEQTANHIWRQHQPLAAPLEQFLSEIMLLAPTCIAHAHYRPNLVSTVTVTY